MLHDDVQQTDAPLTTSAVARALGCAEGTVLALERRGVLRCTRTTTGQRLFAAADVERLADARRAARRSS